MPVWDSWGLNLGQGQGQGLQNLSQLAGLRPFGDRFGVQRATVNQPTTSTSTATAATPATPAATPRGAPQPMTNGPQRALEQQPAPRSMANAQGQAAMDAMIAQRNAALAGAAGRVPTMTPGGGGANLRDFAPRRTPQEFDTLRADHRERGLSRQRERQPAAQRFPFEEPTMVRTPIGLGPVVNGTATYSPVQLAALQAQTHQAAMDSRNQALETARAIMSGQLSGDAALQAIERLTGVDRQTAQAIVAGLPQDAQVTVGLPGQGVIYAAGPDEAAYGVGGAGLAGLPGASASPQIEWAPDWTHYVGLGR
jgi:hypothetical protein